MGGTPASNRFVAIWRSYGMTPEEFDAMLAAGKKLCIKCKEIKSLDAFGVDRSRKSGVNPRCRACCVQHTTEMRRSNPRTFELREVEGRKRQLKKAGTSLEEYNDLVMAQCGACACCGELATGYSGKLVPHHCHKTGRFVSLVCSACNLGMGKFRDDPELMRRAAELNEVA